MAEVKLMDVVRTLADEIGPRPTGTEEEQRAAIAIQQWFQKDAGLPAAIEEVDGDPELGTAQNLCFTVAFIATFLAYVIKPLALPAIILTLACAVILLLENLDRPVLTRFLRKGISQNVVAVYEPEQIPTEEEAARAGRTRKIVLIAHYDTSRVRAETNGGLARIAAFSNTVETFSAFAAPLVMFVHYTFFMYADNLVGSILSIVTMVLLLILGLRLLKIFARRFAKYNDGANCNASGVAVLVNLAQRINGSYMGPSATPVRHGAEAAQAAGVVPEGASLHYEADAEGGEGGRAAAAASGAVGAAGAVAPSTAEADGEGSDASAWRGRATAARGYASAETGTEVFTRPFGSVPGIEVDNDYASGFSVPPEQFGGASSRVGVGAAAPMSESGTIRAEAGEVNYMGDNPRLEAARAALRAKRAADGDLPDVMPSASPLLGNDREAAVTRPTSAASMARSRGVADIDFSTRQPRAASTGFSAVLAATEAASAAAVAAAPAARVPAVAPVATASAVAVAAPAPAAPATVVGAPVSTPVVSAPVPVPIVPAPIMVPAPVVSVPAAVPETAASPVASVASEVAPAAVVSSPAPVSAAPAPAPAQPAVPDWFTRAKANVRRTDDAAPITRSVFNDALDAAANVSAVQAGAVFAPAAAAAEAPKPAPVAEAPAPEAAVRPRASAYAIPAEQAADTWAAPVPAASPAPAPAPSPELASSLAPAPAAAAYAQPAAEQYDGITSPFARVDVTAPFQPVAQPASAAAVAPAVPVAAPLPVPAPLPTPAPVPAPSPYTASVPQPTTGFAGALAVAEAVEERQLADGTLSRTPLGIPTTLPDAGATGTIKPITMEDLQQRAPLAQAETSSQQAAKSLLTMLPTISLADPEDLASAAPAAPAAAAAVPDIAQPAPKPAASFGAAGMTGVFAPVGNEFLQNADEDSFVDDADDSSFQQNFTQTGAFAGPGYVEMPTSRAKGVLGKLFGGKKNRQEETSPQEWLGVDNDFDARAAGAARGGWESFRGDYGDYGDYGYAYPEDGFADGYEGGADDWGQYGGGGAGAGAGRNWNGGAFSLKGLAGARGKGAGARAGKRGRQDDAFDAPDADGFADYDDMYEGGYDAAYDNYGGYDNYGYDTGAEAGTGAAGAAGAGAYADGYEDAEDYGAYRRPLHGGDAYDDGSYDETFAAEYGTEGYDANADGYADAYADTLAVPDAAAATFAASSARPSTMDDFAAPSFSEQDKNLQEIFDFRDANINAEVWFVALGSESPNNSGMRAFLDAHGNELRNALFVEIEGLGAGDLCLTATEGRFRKYPVSTRMRRLVQKAQEAMRIKVGSCSYGIDNSATYQALKRGMQAMHLVGMEGGKPALQNQANDVADVIDEDKLRRNADFVMELVRSI